MVPYFNYPFPSNRKGVAAPVTPAPVLPTVEQPLPVPMPPSVPEQLPIATQPETIMQPVMPMQPTMPVQPVMPIQQTMPMMPCPQPIMPAQQVMPIMPCPQPIMPAYPVGCPYVSGLGNSGNVANIANLDSMMNMGMNMDMDLDAMAPATASPGDPPPILSNNPVVIRTSVFKELTGFAAYGNPSGNADILYTGNRGTWTFDIPGTVFAPGNQRAQLIIHAVLDDHYNTPVNRYSARITINGDVVHNGPVPLEHGRPLGGRFVNWIDLTFNVRTLRRNTRVVIVNTSTAGADDWIGLDWMELRLFPR